MVARSLRVLVVVAGMFGLARDARAAVPAVTGPVIAVYYANTSALASTTLSVTGHDFGWPTTSTGTYITVTPTGGSATTIRSIAPEVITWTPSLVVLKMGIAITLGGSVAVTNPGGTGSGPISQRYKYDWFDLTGDGVAGAISVDPANGKVWINKLFHRSFHLVDPGPGTATSITIPVPADAGPFAVAFNPFTGGPADYRSPYSITGDDILVDASGNVWLTEGGTTAYRGVNPNHSRIVKYIPASQTFQIYNVPGDNNQVSGLAYANGRIWFASGAHDVENYIENNQPIHEQTHVPAKLVSFDPTMVPFTNGTTYDYTRGSRNLICASGANDAACYHEYPLPDCDLGYPFFCAKTNSTRPARVLVDALGDVWYSDFGGATISCSFLQDPGPFCPSNGLSPGNNLIGRIHPNPIAGGTTSLDQYPLPAPIGASSATGLYGSGPRTLRKTANGDIFFNESLDSTITKLPVALLTQPDSCESLNGSGNNPCLVEARLPRLTPIDFIEGTTDLRQEGVQDIAYDSNGNLWFSQNGPNQAGWHTSVGYVAPDFATVVKLPPLGTFPGDGPFSAAGIAIGTNNTIWFADVFRHRLGRLIRTLP